MFRTRRSFAGGIWLAFVPASLAWLVGTGCSGSGGMPPPQTYPVSGKVFYKGGQPLRGGVIQFQSASDPSLTTKGDIEPDGTFELITLYQNERLAGATRGQYHVTVIPRMADNKPVDIHQLPRLYTIEAKDNTFSIELERPRAR